jgi:hypothetical protein
MEIEFFDGFSKSTKTPSFMKIRLVGAETFHADRQKDRRTDMATLVIACRNFEIAPKSYLMTLW